MDWIINNWYMIIVGIIALIVLGFGVYKFIKLPKVEKFRKIKEVLLYWVTLAEKEYGSGTGIIKLRFVYDKFTAKYRFISIFISFERFSKWVDDALDKMREVLEKNYAVYNIVNK
jgi:hypothetical protein